MSLEQSCKYRTKAELIKNYVRSVNDLLDMQKRIEAVIDAHPELPANVTEELLRAVAQQC